MKGLNTWSKEPDKASQHPTTTDQRWHLAEVSTATTLQAAWSGL